MKSLTVAVTVACAFTAFAMATPARGQPAEPGDLGIYFDPAATVTGGPSGGVVAPGSGVLAPFVFFDIYVISTDVPGGQQRYEFSIDIDMRVTAMMETRFPPASSDSGIDQGNFKNYLVETGGTCYGEGTTEILVQWQALLFFPADDVLFCLGSGVPSSFTPEHPGYLACSGGLRRYGRAYDRCAVGNMLAEPIPIGTEESTWGSVKARF